MLSKALKLFQLMLQFHFYNTAACYADQVLCWLLPRVCLSMSVCLSVTGTAGLLSKRLTFD